MPEFKGFEGRAAEFYQEYQDLCHAMQSGVAMMMEYDPGSTQPKALRVGVNSAHVSVSALATTLMEKGLITPEEYAKGLRDFMRDEVAKYKLQIQAEVLRNTGKRVEITLR